jgi:hypothetical protein
MNQIGDIHAQGTGGSQRKYHLDNQSVRKEIISELFHNILEIIIHRNTVTTLLKKSLEVIPFT